MRHSDLVRIASRAALAELPPMGPRFLAPLLALLGPWACFAPQDPPARTTSAPGPVPFLPAERCALCHSAAPRASALRDAHGADVSPTSTWRATAMASAFVDPYWRAQMAREVELAPERRAEIEALCLTCHAPAAHHAARLAGEPPPTLAGARGDPLAREGVTCTVCHRAGEHGLGTPASFSGNLDIHDEARIYGPYERPFAGPMRMHTGYTPVHGAHVSTSALCGACHTLYTRPAPDAAPFLEQAPYLEWRNSVYADELGPSAETRTCQACHMPAVGATRIARNPGGRDFPIAPRPDVRSHAFRGANTLLAQILAAAGEELGAAAPPAAFAQALAETRAFLAEETAGLALARVEHVGARLELDLAVENRAGHKLPTGYPARRAWLEVVVEAGGAPVFVSGASDAKGRLLGVADELALPHRDVIDEPHEVQVYELVAADLAGRPTTALERMARPLKDTRLLPRGWRADGPHAAETAPVGIGSDDDFSAGGDTVTYSVALEPGVPATIRARLLYQPVPPAWAEALERSATPEARRFLALHAAADPRPEVLASLEATVAP